MTARGAPSAGTEGGAAAAAPRAARRPARAGRPAGSGPTRSARPAPLAAGAAVLPDVVAPRLRLLLCGSAAGAVSARVGAPYAGPGNRFWRTLHEVGLTPRELAPAEFRELARFGIGLTDLCKTASGSDASLPRAADDAVRLAALVGRWRPGVLAFVGKRAARVALGRPAGAYGGQPDRFAGTETWVLPSTSGLAVRWWDRAPWEALAARVR